MKPKFHASSHLNSLFAPLFGAGFTALIVVSGSAAEIVYRPILSSTTDASVNTNWVGNVLPGTVDIAYWNATSRPNVSVPSAVTWGAIRFEDADTATILSSSPITLLGVSAPLYGGPAVVQGITEVRFENVTVGNNIVLGSNQTWNTGGIGNTGGAALTINGTLSGAFNLTKVGFNSLTLNANNSGYTNSITVNNGTLNVAAIGGSLALTTGTLNAFGVVGGSLSVTGGTANVSNIVTGSVALTTGTLNLNSGASISSPTFNSGTLTVNAGSTVTGAITTLGTATLNLGGAVGGTVTLGPSDTLGLRGSAITGNLILDSNTLNRISSVTASGNIQVTGANVVNIASAAFGVPMTILSCAGTLTDTDDSDPANNFTLGNSGSFRSVPVLTTTSNSVQVTIAAGAARTWAGAAAINPTFWDVNTTSNWTAGDSLFLNGDAVTFDDTATPVTPVTVAIQGLVSPSAITFNNTTKAYTVSSSGAANGITGSTGLTKSGAGVLTLGGGGSTFSGNVQVNAGSLVINNWEALGATGKTVTIASGAVVNLNGNSPSSSGRHYTWNIAGDGVAGSGAITNSGAGVFNNAGIQTLQLSANASVGGPGRFDIGRSGNNFGTIQGNGFNFTKNGANLVVVRAPASNISYVLNSGGLTFEDSDAATGPNTITVNGGTLGSFGTRTFGNNLNFTAAGAILESGGNVGTWNGNIALNGDVTFRCNNVLVINGTISGTGNITKEGGSAFRIGTGGATGDIGTRNVNTTAASRLEVNRSGSLTMAGNITGLNAFSALGSGTVTLSGNNTWSNETRVLGGGTLSVATVADGGGVGALGTGNPGFGWLRVAANSTLRITGTGTQTTDRALWNDNTTGAESGTGIFDVVDAGASVVFSSTTGANNQSLTKIGAGSLTLSRFITGTAAVTVGGGTLVLTGANNHTGGTVVNAGTLSIGNGGATGTNTGNITNNASVVFNSSASSTHSGIISGSGTLQKQGAGTLFLSNANTYAGSTTVNGGTLNLLDNASLRFVIGANGVNNTLTGGGTAILGGDFVLDLSGASSTNGNSWQLVNVGTLTETFDPTFTLVGFTEVANVHTLTVGATTWTFTEATGLLAASSAANPFTTWIDGFTFAPGADKTPTGDPDGDGLNNQQEYAFGLLPNDGSSVNAITVQVDKTTGTFTYTRRKPALTGLNYKVWTSTDLSEWTQDLTAVQSPTDVGNNQTVVVTLTGAPLTATKLFVRVTAD